MPNVSNLVKKTTFNAKTNETEKKIADNDHDKYITTPEINKVTSENFAARLGKANFANKNHISSFSTLTFYRKYLGCWFGKYVID